ncbi:hypothetical protein EYR40_006393 [Pleurotus pulmonarius]|nr:hypothetical protein EYR40_006393 [Pleurotus pulmonarius]
MGRRLLQEQFDQSTHAMTTAITLTLLLRPVGAFIVGLLADRFGRKWPLVGVLLVIAGLQIITSFMTTFSKFLAVRSLYGIAMGGVWGVAGAASLEIFWFGAGLSVVAACIIASLPESAVFKRSKEVARRKNMTAIDKAVVFTQLLGRMFKDHWALWVYGVVFISGLQFLAHSSQDLYTTFLQASKGFSASLANEANIVGEAGALIGGALGGYLSQFLGRKITIVFACFWSAAFIPLWILPSSWGRLSIGAFFFQVGVNIAWGTIAIHLNELAPPAFRGAFTGTVHQMGNMASSASAQIIVTYDFFCVSLTILQLQAQFNRDTHAMTTAITLTLLFRPVGAIIFGLLADRFGRKWPLVADLAIIAVLQVGTGFVTTFSEFLAVRSLFGMAMGGVWGLASAASMEYVGSLHPSDLLIVRVEICRSHLEAFIPDLCKLDILADIHLQLVASIVNLYLVPESPQTWRSIFWVGAGLSAFAAFIRILLPESAIFQRAPVRNISTSKATALFARSVTVMLKKHWGIWIYGILLATGLNFLAHSSQDLYTTFMQKSKGFSPFLATRANIVGETGAVLGALLGGYISQFLGRKNTLILSIIWCGGFIPLWVLPSSWGSLSVGAFFFQAGVNIAWGMVAAYLNELAPPAFRGLYPGTVYQLGNAASSAASQIEATAGLTIRKQVQGVDQPDYGTVQAIMAAASGALVLGCALFGPENHSVDLNEAKTAIEEGKHIGQSSNVVDDIKLTDEHVEHTDTYIAHNV